MKIVLSALLLGIFSFSFPISSPPRPVPQAGASHVDRKPVIVELFTSEGCSSCPPADALLRKLETDQPIAGAEVIGLEEHVDYWNHDGWFDSYSSPEWTSRQEDYVARLKSQTPYTPQMIVDGQSQFVGNSASDAQKAIRDAVQRARTDISITPQTPANGDTQRLEVRVGGAAGNSGQEPADVWVAVTEEGLGTDVKAGENAGRNVPHAAIVRSLHKIGVAPARGSTPSVLNPQVKLKSNWKRENLQIVVFVQERKTLRILGAASTRVAS